MSEQTFQRLSHRISQDEWGIGAWITVLSLAAWVRWLDPALLALAAVALVLSLLAPRFRSGAGAFAAVALILAVLAAFGGSRELDRIALDWESIREVREDEVQALLSGAMDRTIEEGDLALELLLATPIEEATASPTLASIRRATRMEALAIFDGDGQLVSWDGTHHGRIPAAARAGESLYLYAERPLFGYLYFTAPMPDGEGTAMAARLLRSDLPPTLNGADGGFASQFEAATGAVVQISTAERIEGESVWDLRWENEVLLSVALAPVTQAQLRERLVARWGGIVTVLLLLAWLLLARATAASGGSRLPAGLSVVAVVLLLPVGALMGLPALFSPADFLLPGPLDITLGRLLVLGAVGALLVGFLRTPSGGLVRALLGVTAALAGYATVLWFFRNGAAPELLAGGDIEWVGYTVTLGLFLSLVGAVTLRPIRSDDLTGRRYGFLLLSLVAAAALSIALTFRVFTGPVLPWSVLLLWALPFLFATMGLDSGDGMRAPGLRWLVAIVLGMSLALPFAFGDRVTARMTVAEREVERLGTRVDPYLEFLLHRMGEEAAELRRADRDPVEILYGAWMGSGLGWEGYPIWLTHWSPDGMPVEELMVGVSEERPPIPVELVDEADDTGNVVIRRFEFADMHYVAVVPLPEGGRVTAVLPPRRALAPASPLGPLLTPDRPGRETLVLIPLLPGEVPGETGVFRWIPTEEGWQAELYLAYPDEVYHAHYIVDLPGRVLLVARGALVTLALVLALGLLWLTGRWLAGGSLARALHWPRIASSFRTRVTLALFAFFLVPTLVFGMMAYRTLHGASVRAAEVLAERAVEDAAGWFLELDREMGQLSRRVGSDLLLYDRGELTDSSLPALTELGLYPGWLPRRVHRTMEEGEELMMTLPASLGGWDYVVAYRRVTGQQVLAAPAPVEVGAMALRQREITDLLAFAVVLGAGLSILLALVVGRALARPIHTLQVASERVGAGNLGVHIPEDRTDEFGSVFSAFNRMVRRLRRARKALIRSTRRSRAIVEEVATGVVALDSEGRVVLANPMAENLLGVELPSGTHLSSREGDRRGGADEFFRWLAGYFRDDLEEESVELQVASRRIRVRARRISRRGPRGGAVVSLEDVTDELRSERILAWGEMARQVAHEVKNPLTPIKLGVQHIRRAWRDQRPDFTQILEGNADAILREIDRLAKVATGFSRFAAPDGGPDLPLEPVRVEKAVDEVLTLYQAGDGPVEFDFEAESGIESVRAREAEFKEVLVNLLENSRAALSNGGAVRISARSRGTRVEVTVEDDGAGIPREDLPRIFDPYFSTRSSGSGLGLAIVRRLVESWGGEVTVESVQGEGTTVRLSLPRWSVREGETGGDPEIG